MKSAIKTLISKKEKLLVTSEELLNKQHSNHKLSARERINVLLDPDSFQEYYIFSKHRSTDFNLDKKSIPYDGVITGYGTIFGRPVYVYSQDFTIFGGSVGEIHAKKISELQKKAINSGIPIIGIKDSGGARIQEGIDALAGYGEIFQNNIDASGFIPQISVIMGPCAGGAVYSPALTDFIAMVESSSYMFVTGPNVVKKIMNETVNSESLGGSYIHSNKSGVANLVYQDDIEALLEIRRLYTFLPLNCNDDTNIIDTNDSIERQSDLLDSIIPVDENIPYNMLDIILQVVDNYDFFEIHKNFAKNIIVGFGRINGRTVGIVANQPLELAGCLDINSSRKAARFVRFCDAFNIPIINFVDVPGFMPGTNQEHNGIINHGAKLLYAYGEATVPKITIITRKAYGGAYIVMGSKHLLADLNYAWPYAEIAVLGAEGAGEILFKKTSSNEQEYAQKLSEYRDKFCNPYLAAERGYIEDIIKPHMTREIIIRGLELLKNKSVIKKINKKHDNLPL
jgi:propionyl-CoA carboxylase beta chain